MKKNHVKLASCILSVMLSFSAVSMPIYAEEGNNAVGEVSVSQTDTVEESNVPETTDDLSEKTGEAVEVVEDDSVKSVDETIAPSDTEEQKNNEVPENDEDKKNASAVETEQNESNQEADSSEISVVEETKQDSAATQQDSSVLDETPFSYSETVDGYAIKLSAEAGVFPAGTNVSIAKVSEERNEEIENLVEDQLAESQIVKKVVAFLCFCCYFT